MISKLTHVTLFVENQDEALKFYTSIGFRVHTDAMFGETMRWLTITPSQQDDLEIALMLAESDAEKALIGKQGGKKPFLAFACADCDQTHEQYKKIGIKIVSAPEQQPWGVSMTIEDLYGNQLYIVEG